MSRSSLDLLLVLVSLNLVACGTHASDAAGIPNADASAPASSDAGVNTGAGASEAGASDGGYPQLLIEPDQGMTPIYDSRSAPRRRRST